MPYKDPAKDKKWREKNRTKCNRWNLNWRNRQRPIWRSIVLRHYGGNPPICKCCGETIEEFLTIDHINGHGNEHRRQNKIWSGSGFYYWLIRKGFPLGFQVLCFNCNHGKTLYGRCPHEEHKPTKSIE